MTNRTRVVDRLVYKLTLIILGHGRFVQFFVKKKSADSPLAFPVLTGLESKRKMSELSGRDGSHFLVKNNSTLS